MAKKSVISGPLPGSGPTRAYQPVSGGLATLPSLNAWKHTTLGDTPPRDSILMRIDECLKTYPGPIDGWDRLALLGELYFATDFFLRRAPKINTPQYVNRVPMVEQLYLTVVDMLCKAFGCSVNFLPQMLEECWGRVLTHHGWEVDTQHKDKKVYRVGASSPVATYLTRAQVEKFRLRYYGGRVQMHNPKKLTDWVPADSRGIGWEDARLVHPAMMLPGYAGFALSVGREMYMARHKGCFHKDNFFHSSYLSGDTVLCTGTVLIENGIVKGVKNDSGHYQPSIEHLVNVAEMMRMHGVNLAGVKFTAVAYSWRDHQGKPGTYEVSTTGDQLLKLRGGGTGLHERINRNEANVATRGGGGAGFGAVAQLPNRPPAPIPVKRVLPPPPPPLVIRRPPPPPPPRKVPPPPPPRK